MYIQARPGIPVASLVANGTVELGFQQLAELIDVPGVDVVGPLPKALDLITIFSGGVAANCRRPDEARALLAFLASPAAADVKRRYHLEPA